MYTLSEITGLPLGLHTFALAGLVGGFILWLLGGKLLRPAFALVGIAVGAGLGGVLIPAVALSEIFGYPALYVGMIIGAILGLTLAMTLFRFAMGLSGAVVFGTLGVLAAGIHLSRTPDALPLESPARLATPEGRQEILGELKQDLTDAESQLGSGSSVKDVLTNPESAARAKSVALELGHHIADLWSRTPEPSKLTLAGGGFGGALLGLLIGVVMPKKSAAMFTAFLGAASLLASGTWLANAMALPGKELLNRGPVGTLFIWLALGITGLLVQTMAGKKEPTKKPEPPKTA